MTTLAELHGLDDAAFVALLAGIFEKSPWVAERVTSRRPFASVDALHAAMVEAIEGAGVEAQLALIRAHPELAGKAAIAGDMTDESKREQAGAGLDRCTAAEFAQMHALNAAYNQRFGHPFILAVRGHTRHSILAEFERRLHLPPDEERRECLRQIYRIGAFRLHDLLGDAPGPQGVPHGR
jgi:2-oxo-4-hydroxy-4-carboxy-5-ureidoimidazoline decarboxylase